ncbi:MAG: OmpH family outer membrane protein [Bacteroidales bacterium]
MMKRTFLLLTAFLGLTLGSMNAQSQGKYGHVNSGEILQAMPGVDSLQIKLTSFQKELEDLYQGMVAEFQTKKDKFDKEAGTMSSSVRQLREKELYDIQNRIQEFQYGVQDDIEQKQYELAKPFQDKIQNAINEVAKENNYSYIFDTQILLFYDNGENVTPLVKKKLGIK